MDSRWRIRQSVDVWGERWMRNGARFLRNRADEGGILDLIVAELGHRLVHALRAIC